MEYFSINSVWKLCFFDHFSLLNDSAHLDQLRWRNFSIRNYLSNFLSLNLTLPFHKMQMHLESSKHVTHVVANFPVILPSYKNRIDRTAETININNNNHNNSSNITFLHRNPVALMQNVTAITVVAAVALTMARTTLMATHGLHRLRAPD